MYLLKSYDLAIMVNEVSLITSMHYLLQYYFVL